MKKLIRPPMVAASVLTVTAGLTLGLAPAGAVTIGGWQEKTVGPNMAIGGGCSGTLLNRQWVITSWHCYDPKTIRTEIGYWGNLDYEKGNKVNVVQVCHRYDLAMVKIAPPLPAALPRGVFYARLGNANPPVGKVVVASGWGESEFGTGRGAGILRSTEAKVVPPWANGRGDAFGGPSFTIGKIARKGILARGDSGGGTYYRGALVGVNSNSDGQSASLSSVAAHRNWIDAVMTGRKIPNTPAPAAICHS